MNTLVSKFAYFPALALLCIGLVCGDLNVEAGPTSTTAPSPQYKKDTSYIPHAAYLNSNGYVDGVPYGASYPIGSVGQNPLQLDPPTYFYSLLPTGGLLELTLRAIAKTGAVLIGSVLLVFLSTVLTTGLCHFTNICDINFPALENIDKDTMRTLINPEKISTAAALVQDAIGKYQRMQRATGN